MSYKTNFDDLFENDFFKDRFDTRVEKHLKSYNRRIEALEKVLQDFMEIVDVTITENVDGESLDYYREKKEELLEKLDVGSASARESLDRQTECKHEWVYTTEEQIRCDKCDQLKTEKKEYECPYCYGLIKFRRKYKSDDEDIIYEFYCPKCKKKIKGGYPDSFLKTDSGGEKEGWRDTTLARGFINSFKNKDEKLPEPECGNCKYVESYSGKFCAEIVGECLNFEKFEPKEKTEPEKSNINIDTYSENTNEAIELFKQQIEERVRDATRKELIEEFLKRIDWIMQRIFFHTENPDSELMDEVSEEYKKWQGRVK